MAGIFGYSREAVRVKVKKCEGFLPPEWRKFSVDPQITSLEVLFSILAKAFDLRTDFAISQRELGADGLETFAAVLSDWDLDAAFLRAHNVSVATTSEPCLNLRIDIKPFSEAPDWDATVLASTTVAAAATAANGGSVQLSPAGGATIPQQQQQQQQHQSQSQNTMNSSTTSIGSTGQKYVQTMQTRLPGLIMNQMEKTISLVTRALNFVDDQQSNLLPPPPPRPPLSDTEFRSYLDSVGQIIQPHQLRRRIYAGGIEPSLRRVVWKHILNVYPDGMTGRERMDYMKRKSAEYQRLRDTWRQAVQRGAAAARPASSSNGHAPSELAYVTGAVRKDVLRTDRLHPFYAGTDDNQNIGALFNILTTYALNHPAVSYCQGMSDIASPLLVTMCDEAQAYICFCAVMRRLAANFQMDGVAMTLKFQHLGEALQFYDPAMAAYLREQQADDLLFCYRWLLLEMKREFAFEDALRMLEVLWSALPADAPSGELRLAEREFVAPMVDGAVDAGAAERQQTLENKEIVEGGQPAVQMRAPRETAYTKICALRRQSSAQSLLLAATAAAAADTNGHAHRTLDATRRLNHSLDETATARRRSRIVSVGSSRPTHQSLDERAVLLVEPESEVAGAADPNVAAQRKGGGHFKELKERIVAGKKATQPQPSVQPTPPVAKVVRHFSEFLNLGKTSSAAATSELPPPSTATAAGAADCSSPDDSQEYFPMNTSMTRELRLDLENLDRQVFGVPGIPVGGGIGGCPFKSTNPFLADAERSLMAASVGSNGSAAAAEMGYTKLSAAPSISLDMQDVVAAAAADDDDELAEISRCPSDRDVVAVMRRPRHNGTPADGHRNSMNRCSTSSANADVFVWENPLHCFSPPTGVSPPPSLAPRSPDEQQELDLDAVAVAETTTSSSGCGSYIETQSEGKMAITPIRLVQQQQQHRGGSNGVGGRATASRRSMRDGGIRHYSGDSSDTTEATSSSSSDDDDIVNDVDDDDADDEDNWRPSDTVVQQQQQLTTIAISAASPVRQVPTNGHSTEPPPPPLLSSSVEEASEADVPTKRLAARSPAPLPPSPSPPPLLSASPQRRLAGALPPPHEFGGGNPFLMFLCVTLLMQHRNYVMRAGMDYNEMAMHFDKMVRKHNVTRVLAQARRMYGDYMRQQQQLQQQQQQAKQGPADQGNGRAERGTTPSDLATADAAGDRIAVT